MKNDMETDDKVAMLAHQISLITSGEVGHIIFNSLMVNLINLLGISYPNYEKRIAAGDVIVEKIKDYIKDSCNEEFDNQIKRLYGKEEIDN